VLLGLRVRDEWLVQWEYCPVEGGMTKPMKVNPRRAAPTENEESDWQQFSVNLTDTEKWSAFLAFQRDIAECRFAVITGIIFEVGVPRDRCGSAFAGGIGNAVVDIRDLRLRTPSDE
jgi:hypothetical protein